MDKLSIIIPVYNLETYIGKCLDSIIKQLPLDGLHMTEKWCACSAPSVYL